MVITTSNSCHGRTVRPWTQSDLNNFQNVNRFLISLLDMNEMLANLKPQLFKHHFCLAPAWQFYWDDQTLTIMNECAVEIPINELRKVFPSIEIPHLASYEAGTYHIRKSEGKLTFNRSFASRYFDGENTPSILCDRTILPSAVTYCFFMVEELAHGRSLDRDNTLPQKQVELEGQEAVAILLDFLRPTYGRYAYFSKLTELHKKTVRFWQAQ